MNMLKPIGDALVLAGVIPGDSVKYVTDWRIGYGGEWDGPTGAVAVVRVVAAEGIDTRGVG